MLLRFYELKEIKHEKKLTHNFCNILKEKAHFRNSKYK